MECIFNNNSILNFKTCKTIIQHPIDFKNGLIPIPDTFILLKYNISSYQLPLFTNNMVHEGGFPICTLGDTCNEKMTGNYISISNNNPLEI